jgi:hypothetical protein
MYPQMVQYFVEKERMEPKVENGGNSEENAQRHKNMELIGSFLQVTGTEINLSFSISMEHSAFSDSLEA